MLNTAKASEALVKGQRVQFSLEGLAHGCGKNLQDAVGYPVDPSAVRGVVVKEDHSIGMVWVKWRVPGIPLRMYAVRFIQAQHSEIKLKPAHADGLRELYSLLSRLTAIGALDKMSEDAGIDTVNEFCDALHDMLKFYQEEVT